MNSSKTDSPSRFGLSRPVWLLGWVSFFTDTASEMVYPLLPLFLTRVLGAGAMSLGVIEGVAEAARARGLRSIVPDPPPDCDRDRMAPGARAAVCRPARKGHPHVSARRDA